METLKKQVSKKDLIVAVHFARVAAKDKHRRTKLAFFCEKFLEKNEKTIETVEKSRRKIITKFTNELDEIKVNNCLEKDGQLVFTEKGDYSFGKESTILVKRADIRIADDMKAADDEFLNEKIEVIIFVSPMDSLPTDIEYDLEKSLNGFVYKNKSEFSESFTEENPKLK